MQPVFRAVFLILEILFFVGILGGVIVVLWTSFAFTRDILIPDTAGDGKVDGQGSDT